MTTKHPQNPSGSTDSPYKASLEFLRAVYDTSPDIIFVFGPQDEVVDVNRNALLQLQYTKAEFLAAKKGQFIKAKMSELVDVGSDVAHTAHSISTSDGWYAMRRDGTEFPIEVRITHLPKGLMINKIPATFLCTVRDISERKAYEEKILRLAHYDLVTGLINRTLLEDRARQAIVRAKRHDLKMAFLFLDLDHFKKVNDEFGHKVGDRLLKAVGMRIQTVVRENDTFGRLGGDEFLILAEEIQFADDARLIAEKIILTLSEAFGIEGQVIHTGTSIGISIFPEHGDELVELIHNADKAMYRAKQLGRNQTAIYNPNLVVDR